MNHRVAISAAVALIFSQGVFAQSSVALYGRLDEDINYSHFSSGGAKNSPRSGTSLDSDAAFWGLRITEDLGGQTKFFAKLENGFYLSNGALFKDGYLFNRQAYAGLENGQYGSIFFGQQYAPEFYVSAYADPFGRLSNGSIISLFQVIPGSNSRGFNPGINNSVQYWTPEYRGLQAKLMYAFSNGGTTAASNIGEAEGASLMYRSKSLYIAASYNNQRIAGTLKALASVSNTTYQVAATYDFHFVKLHGYVMRNDQRNQPTSYGYLLGLSSYVTPFDELMFSAAKRSSPTPQSGAEMLAVGMNHYFSKRTLIYASFAYLNNDRKAAYSLWPALLSYRAQGLPAAGQNETSVMVGLRHYF